MKILVYLFSTVFPLLFTQHSYAQKRKPLPVLIVDGFSNHDWAQTTAVTKFILQESGLFDVDVSTIPADSLARTRWLPDFGQYAVVIQNTNNIQAPALRWPRDAEKALETFVETGGGLYILHSANNAYPHWEAYNIMIGMGWRPVNYGYALEIDSASHNVLRIPPGEGGGTGHGSRFNAIIHVLNRHPINQDFPDQWKTANTEVYYFPRGPVRDLTVLSWAYDSSSTHRRWPVEWVVNYGKGRVYNSSLGHLWKGETYPPSYRCAGYQTTVIRATEWLATGKVSYPVPTDFPTKDSVSLRGESGFLQVKAGGKNP